MPVPIELRTQRLLLRRWRDSDREPFAAMNADPRVMEFFPAVQSRSASDASIDSWEKQFAERGWSNWAVELLFTSVLNVRSQAVMRRIGMSNTQQDFEHPGVPEGHPLRLHCLYRMSRQQWGGDGGQVEVR